MKPAILSQLLWNIYLLYFLSSILTLQNCLFLYQLKLQKKKTQIKMIRTTKIKTQSSQQKLKMKPSFQKLCLKAKQWVSQDCLGNRPKFEQTSSHVMERGWMWSESYGEIVDLSGNKVKWISKMGVPRKHNTRFDWTW